MGKDNKKETGTGTEIEIEIENQPPGFNTLPDPDAGKPAPTDMINDAVGKIIDNIQKEATGHAPRADSSDFESKSKSETESESESDRT